MTPTFYRRKVTYMSKNRQKCCVDFFRKTTRRSVAQGMCATGCPSRSFSLAGILTGVHAGLVNSQNKNLPAFVALPTGGLVRTEVMAVLPSVSPSVCLLLSALACCPALLRAWKNPSPPVFAWGVVRRIVLVFCCMAWLAGWLTLPYRTVTPLQGYLSNAERRFSGETAAVRPFRSLLTRAGKSCLGFAYK